MSDDALREEVRQLRSQIAGLEAARDRPAGLPAEMKDFRQLNDAITEGRLQSFAWKLQPRCMTNADIASHFGISVKAVEWRMAQALQRCASYVRD